MFAGINVGIFEKKKYSLGLIFVVCSGLDNYLGAWIIFAGIYFCKMVTNSLNKSHANIVEFTLWWIQPCYWFDLSRAAATLKVKIRIGQILAPSLHKIGCSIALEETTVQSSCVTLHWLLMAYLLSSKIVLKHFLPWVISDQVNMVKRAFSGCGETMLLTGIK